VAIARGGIAVSGSYQASKRSLNVHLNQANSKSKARSANFAIFLRSKNIYPKLKFPGEKNVKENFEC
jgi:hypothetical protein